MKITILSMESLKELLQMSIETREAAAADSFAQSISAAAQMESVQAAALQRERWRSEAQTLKRALMVLEAEGSASV